MRPSGRLTDALRPITIDIDVTKHAEGSCLIRMGDTHVLCTASVEDKPPPFLRNSGQGWVTAEYGMLPRASSPEEHRKFKGLLVDRCARWWTAKPLANARSPWIAT